MKKKLLVVGVPNGKFTKILSFPFIGALRVAGYDVEFRADMPNEVDASISHVVVWSSSAAHDAIQKMSIGVEKVIYLKHSTTEPSVKTGATQILMNDYRKSSDLDALVKKIVELMK